MKNLTVWICLVALMFTCSGCGYTTASLLPDDVKSIHVDNFVNMIDPAMEVSDRRSSYSYWPGLETSITRSVIDQFIIDGNLAIKSAKKADLLLKGELTNFQQVPLSYDKNENVIEFRVEIMVNIELYDPVKDELVWKEDSFMGQSSYTISGPNSKTQSQAIRDAVKDLAVRIVERTVEAW